MRYLLFFLILSFVLGNEQDDKKGNAFLKSLSSILVSELGDKVNLFKKDFFRSNDYVHEI